MRVQVNGEPTEVGAATVAALLEEIGVRAGARGVAVAANGRVVPRASWSTTAIAEGDRLEIVRPFAGG